MNLTLSHAGVRVRDAQSVLDPHRVRAMLGRLAPAERGEALRGLATLARAAREEMHAQHEAGRPGPAGASRRRRIGVASVNLESAAQGATAGGTRRRSSR